LPGIAGAQVQGADGDPGVPIFEAGDSRHGVVS
jgi:hypothetical protein